MTTPRLMDREPPEQLFEERRGLHWRVLGFASSAKALKIVVWAVLSCFVVLVGLVVMWSLIVTAQPDHGQSSLHITKTPSAKAFCHGTVAGTKESCLAAFCRDVAAPLTATTSNEIWAINVVEESPPPLRAKNVALLMRYEAHPNPITELGLFDAMKGEGQCM